MWRSRAAMRPATLVVAFLIVSGLGLAGVRLDGRGVAGADSNDRWPTYTDRRLGVSFAVPGDWRIDPAPVDGPPGSVTTIASCDVAAVSGIADCRSTGGVKIEVGVEPYAMAGGVSLADWLAPDPDAPGRAYADSAVSLSGSAALRRTYDGADGYVLYVPRASTVYFVAVWRLGSPPAPALAQAEAIVRSLSLPAVAPRAVAAGGPRRRLFAADLGPGAASSRRAPLPASSGGGTASWSAVWPRSYTMLPLSPEGFRLPFAGRQMITLAPRCPGTPNFENEAIVFSLRYEPVLATADGTIAYAAFAGSEGLGNLIKIVHGDGHVSYYGHLGVFGVVSGTVRSGQFIAVSGRTGSAPAPQLHYEVRTPAGASDLPLYVRDMPGLVWYSNDPDHPCTSETYAGHGTGPSEISDGAGECLAESDHPYANRLDQTWWIHNPDTDAAASRVQFSRLELESGFDELALLDGSGLQVQRISGSYPQGLLSEPIPGRVAQLRLRTSASDTAWGFCAERVETVCTDDAQLTVASEPPTIDLRSSTTIHFDVKNTGTCTWTQETGYLLWRVFRSEMFSSESQPLPSDVAPGETAHLEMQLTAPDAEGTFRPHWMLRHGQKFFGPDMPIDINVIDMGAVLPTPPPDLRPIRDLGFSVAKDGYSFTNYGGQYPWPPASDDFGGGDLVATFGAAASCAYADAQRCVLRPQASEWLELANGAMNGGHSDGLATTSLRFFAGIDDPATIQAGATSAHALTQANARRTIAAYAVRQMTDPVAAQKEAARRQAPAQIVSQLLDALAGPAADPPVLFVRKSGRGGHTLVPYAIYDLTSGVYRIMVYDSNHPDDAARFITVDSKRNTWRYDLGGAIGTWTGTASSQSMGMVPVSLYGQAPACEWCAGASHETARLEGDGGLVAVDGQNRRTGVTLSRRLTEIPGGRFVDIDGGLGSEVPPALALPEPGPYTLRLTGEGIFKRGYASVSDVGPGYAILADGALSPGATEEMTTGGAGDVFQYRVTMAKELTLTLATDIALGGARVRFGGLEVDAGQAVTVTVARADNRFFLRNGRTPAQYDLDLSKADAKGEQRFLHRAVPIEPGAVHVIDLGAWDGFGPLEIGIDRDGDGTVDEQRTLDNWVVRIELPDARK